MSPSAQEFGYTGAMIAVRSGKPGGYVSPELGSGVRFNTYVALLTVTKDRTRKAVKVTPKRNKVEENRISKPIATQTRDSKISLSIDSCWLLPWSRSSACKEAVHGKTRSHQVGCAWISVYGRIEFCRCVVHVTMSYQARFEPAGNVEQLLRTAPSRRIQKRGGCRSGCGSG